jgi:hypothetical protein
MGAEGGEEGGARGTAGPRPRLLPQFRRQAQVSTHELSGKACASITQNLYEYKIVPDIFIYIFGRGTVNRITPLKTAHRTGRLKK